MRLIWLCWLLLTLEVCLLAGKLASLLAIEFETDCAPMYTLPTLSLFEAIWRRMSSRRAIAFETDCLA